MLVLLLVIGAFLVFRELNRTTPESMVRTVDYVQVAEFARAEASFDVLVPESLPPGWRATTATYTPGADEAWHLGLLTDEDKYVGLEQAASSPSAMVETHVGEEAVRGEAVRIEGRSWTSWSDDGGDDALVRRDGDTTTLVVGTTGQDVLADYVGSLVPR